MPPRGANLAPESKDTTAILKAIRPRQVPAKCALIWQQQKSLNGNIKAMIESDVKQRILDAVDAGFDAQLATTRDFVAIPSTRGAEGPCQDMIGDLLRRRGYEVDDWLIDVDDLRELRGFGQVLHVFSIACKVVGPYRPSYNYVKFVILHR